MEPTPATREQNRRARATRSTVWLPWAVMTTVIALVIVVAFVIRAFL
jgi:hypothetical protein